MVTLPSGRQALTRYPLALCLVVLLHAMHASAGHGMASTPISFPEAAAQLHTGPDLAPSPAPAQPPVSLLFVQNAGSASLSWQGSEVDGFHGQLVLSNILPTTIWFTDHPMRRAGQLATTAFTGADFRAGGGNDSAWLDTPNAVLVGGAGSGGPLAAVVTLSSPVYDVAARVLTYEIELVEPSDAAPGIAGRESPQYGPLWRPDTAAGVLRLPSPSLFVDGWWWNGIYCLSTLHTDCRFFGYVNSPNFDGTVLFPQYGHNLADIHGEHYSTALSVVHQSKAYVEAADAGYHGAAVKYGAGTVKAPQGRGGE